MATQSTPPGSAPETSLLKQCQCHMQLHAYISTYVQWWWKSLVWYNAHCQMRLLLATNSWADSLATATKSV